MHKAIPAILVTAAAFVVVWRFEPTTAVSGLAEPSTSVGAPAPELEPDPGTERVLGSAQSTRWGPIQVRAVFSGDALTDVEVVQAPDDGPTNRALPQLKAAALEVRSADIDTVTGATMTSEAYIASLRSAIEAN